MAHKKAGGSTALGRDSISKRLGVKVYGDQPVAAGQIIIRQRGTKYRAGDNVRRGGDDTLYAATAGIVKFVQKRARRFNGGLKKATYVMVAK